jgi:hypothetical protein
MSAGEATHGGDGQACLNATGGGMGELTLVDLLNATYKLNDWLNFYWNFYVVFSGVVVGWTFNSKGWKTFQRVAVSICYLGFAAVNFKALYKSYYFLNMASARIETMLPKNDPLGKALVAQLGSSGCVVQLSFHAVTALFVLFCIWRLTR